LHGHSSFSQQHRPGWAESDLGRRMRCLHAGSVCSPGIGRNPADDTINVADTTCTPAFEIRREADQLGRGCDAGY
jgi:hypothetical protein